MGKSSLILFLRSSRTILIKAYFFIIIFSIIFSFNFFYSSETWQLQQIGSWINPDLHAAIHSHYAGLLTKWLSATSSVKTTDDQIVQSNVLSITLKGLFTTIYCCLGRVGYACISDSNPAKENTFTMYTCYVKLYKPLSISFAQTHLQWHVVTFKGLGGLSM